MRKYLLTEREREVLVKRFAGEPLTIAEHQFLYKLRRLAKNDVDMTRIEIDLGLLKKLRDEKRE